MTPADLPVELLRRQLADVTLEVAAAGPPDGPLVILLHGFPDLWQGWTCQIDPLAQAGYRLLMPNQRGYGRSDKPRGVRAYDIDLLADDVAALADSEGRAVFNLIGHDWGGVIGWRVASKFPDRVRRFAALSAPHPGVFHRYALRHPGQLLRSTYAALFQLPWLPEAVLAAANYRLLYRGVKSTGRPGLFDDSDRRYLVDGWSQPAALTSMLNYYRAVARRRPSSMQWRIETPTLILYGRHDPAEQPGLNEASASMCDDYKLLELEDAWHWIQREEPLRVNAELLSFLAVEGSGS